MKQSSKRSMSLIVGALLVVVALFIFFDLIQPAYDVLQTQKGKVSSEQDFLRIEQQAIDQAKSVIAKYNNETAAQETVSLAMPKKQDTAGAIAQIYGIAQSNAITIQTINVAPPTLQMTAQPVAVPSDTGTGASTLLQKNIIKPLGSFNIQVNAISSYENFRNFVAALETNVRVFDVKNVALQTLPNAPRDTFNYTVVVAAYYQAP
jgi:Tfp pilus assembly protein PilO